jgi:hypothetical protein
MMKTNELVSWSEIAARQFETEAAWTPSSEKGRIKLLLEMARTARENPNPNRCRVVN